jgi:dTMP kinase
MTVIRQLNQLATSGVAPELTILLDCPVEIGLERAMARINNSCGAREERFELEALSFHRRVREGYLTLAAKEPERFVIIDSTTSVRKSAADIAAAVLPRLARDNH